MTRAHKGWALDSVVLQNQITRHNKEDITESPNEGVYVHGKNNLLINMFIDFHFTSYRFSSSLGLFLEGKSLC